MEEEALAAVEEAEAEDVVVGEGGDGVEEDVPDEGDGVSAGFAAGYGEVGHL